MPKQTVATLLRQLGERQRALKRTMHALIHAQMDQRDQVNERLGELEALVQELGPPESHQPEVRVKRTRHVPAKLLKRASPAATDRDITLNSTGGAT